MKFSDLLIFPRFRLFVFAGPLGLGFELKGFGMYS